MANPLASVRRLGSGRGRAIGAFLLLGLLALRYEDPPLVEAVRLRSFDMLQRLAPRLETRFPVLIVDIDERSLKELGQWPWPRTRLAQLTDRLTADGAVVIGFDMVFAEPDRTSPEALVQQLQGGPPALLAMLGSLPSHDAQFADALRRSRVVLGEAATETAGPPARSTAPIGRLGADPTPFLDAFRGVVPNLPLLERAAAGRGDFGLVPDFDGVIRRVPSLVRIGSTLTPSLAIEMLRVATGAKALVVKTDPAGISAIVVGGVQVGTDNRGQIWIRFGPHAAQRFVSAADLLAGRVDPARVAGRLVLVGTSAQGLRDIRSVPIAQSMAGVEVHAQLLENIVAQSYLRRPNFALGMELVISALAGVALIVLVPLLGANWTILVPAAVAAAMSAGSWYSFTRYGFLIDATYPTFATTLLYLTLAYSGFVMEERRRKSVARAFGLYLSPVLVERLAKEPHPPQLGGEERDMTVMFADIAGFTTLSERFKDDPQGLTRLINRFLTPMTQAVFDHGGTIDKYIGDSLMAFWNAPLTDAGHAAHACVAALQMARALEALNAELAAEAYGPASAHATSGTAADAASSPLARLDLDARRGIASAQYQLAKRYRDGVGVPRNLDQALWWFRAAAEQGDARAQRNLGGRYAQGDGVPRDDREALFWLTLASEQQLDLAEEERIAILQRLQRADIDAVAARVRAWRPAPLAGRSLRLDMGVGINTGACVVGNMGSKFRFNYSVLGDAVNLASRLEAQTRNYGVGILVSEATRSAAPDLAFLELDLIAVKGKRDAVRIFALLGDETVAASSEFHRLNQAQASFLGAYRAQRWAEARSLAADCSRLWDGLGDLYELYARRITDYERDPPGATWNGVHIAQTK
jgi:adenylate cyclase